jgi:anti-sigma-K factor RskA
MTDRDDIEALAGEYVLGTLDAAERAAVEARRGRDPALHDAIQAWELRLAALNEAAGPIAPSSGVLPRILSRIAPSGATSAQIIDLTGRLKFWRRTAAITSAMAASLLAIFLAREFAPPPKAKNLVAVLQKDAQSPAFLVSVDVDNKLMTVRPVAAKPGAGKSFELWLIHDSLGKPRSLGLIDDPAVIRPAQLAKYDKSVIENATLAVSLEPEGGSPTGDPTGPVLFAGKMIEGSF